MKKFYLVFMAVLFCGCNWITLPKPVITVPPIVINPGVPDARTNLPSAQNTSQCDCDLSGPRLLPLSERGNSITEIDQTLTGPMGCGNFPVDIRLEYIRNDGRAWGFNADIGLAVVLLDNNHFKCRCFDNPRGPGRYHFIGYNARELPELTPAKPGELLPHNGLTFVTYELRAKAK